MSDCSIGNLPQEFRFIDSLVSELVARLPDPVRISEPEGFAYYALHPLDFADAIRSFADAGSVALIGIRGIGTTLSAIALAQLRQQRIPAFRTTVCPVGHPYDRQTYFTASQTEWIDRHRSDGSTFSCSR